MNETTERLLVDWLAEGPDRGPVHGLERALAATRRTSQRPGWTIPERWIPMQLTMRPALSPRPYIVFLAAALLLVVAAGALFVIGSRRQPAPPFGLAGNGPMVVGVGTELWQVAADGSQPRRLNLGMGEEVAPLFSPDGTKLAFVSHPANRTPYALFVANADGTQATNISGGMRIVTWALGGLTWAPDGSSLVFGSSDSGIDRLYRVNVDGSDLRPLFDKDALRAGPIWSPDGAWLAYQRRPLEGLDNQQLAISRPDGTGERILATSQGSPAAFLGSGWTPDSQHIAYFRGNAAVGGHLVATVDLNGRETLLSSIHEDAVNPVVSPDGKRVVFGLTRGAAIVDAADGGNRVDLPPTLAECGAMWSPDARLVLGVGTDCHSMYLIPVDDPASATRLDLPPEEIGAATWRRLAP
jgi:Tol biopolymer transport system component